MAEALGTALSVVGAIGVLGQMFDGCIKAYAVFTTATSLGRDSERLVCKIRIEEMRLLVWGREWGVVEGRLEAHLQAEGNAGNDRMRHLAIQILSELQKAITDVNKLQDRYGLREEPLSPLNEKAAAQAAAAQAPNGEAPSVTSRWKRDLHLRAKWVIGDKEKFTLLLGDLKDYNDGLEQLFPASRLATLHRTWANELLQTAQRDVGQLNLLESASSGTYPQLHASASLKQLRINLDTKPAASFKPTFSMKVPWATLSILDQDTRRSQGAYHGPSDSTPIDILLEWVEYDKEDVDGRFNHVRRIDDLARMIHSASEMSRDLHTMDCLGYTDDVSRCRYGLVYKAPSSSFGTLHSIILDNNIKTPDLGDRFQLAHTMAITLWSLHSLDWLHKSLSSSNILFFSSILSESALKPSATAAGVPDISTPYLFGFDTSRPDSMHEMSVASKNLAFSDLHRHPSSLNGMSRKPYCKSFDIYSLGLILLEIGLWKVLQTFHRPHYSAERFKDKIVIQNLIPNLGSKTGRLYREVVERCMFAKENLTSKEAGLLMECVVGSLETLRV